MAGAKRAPGKPVIADSWKADILGALDAPKPPGVTAGPVARPSPPAAAGDLELVRRILQARDPLALAELEAGIVEAGKGSEALAVWLARPIPRREARDPLDAASDALAAAAAFVESLPPNDRRAATILNAASTLAKLEVMAARAQAAGDIKAGVAALNLLSDIAGLKITKVELTGAGGGPVKVEVDHYWSAMPEGVRELRGAIEAGDDEARARFAGYLVSDSTETSQQIQVLEWAIGVLRSIERRETPALPEAS